MFVQTNVRLSGDKNVETPTKTAEAIRLECSPRCSTLAMFTPMFTLMFSLAMFSLVQAPAATLISHNYLGCAGVANANLGGGATPPFTTREPKLWEHFWREVDATTTSPPH